jgi:hypothetical protein
MEHLFYLSESKNTYLLSCNSMFYGFSIRTLHFCSCCRVSSQQRTTTDHVMIGHLSYWSIIELWESNSSGRLTSTLIGHSPVWHMLFPRFFIYQTTVFYNKLSINWILGFSLVFQKADFANHTEINHDSFISQPNTYGNTHFISPLPVKIDPDLF